MIILSAIKITPNGNRGGYNYYRWLIVLLRSHDLGQLHLPKPPPSSYPHCTTMLSYFPRGGTWFRGNVNVDTIYHIYIYIYIHAIPLLLIFKNNRKILMYLDNWVSPKETRCMLSSVNLVCVVSCGYSCDNSADFQQSQNQRFSVCSVLNWWVWRPACYPISSSTLYIEL